MDLLSLYHQHPSVSTDTRKIKTGDLFFALRGDNFNGNKFAAKALEAGAAAVIIDDPEYHHGGDARYVLVKNSLQSLQELATARREELAATIVGLTGSNGKTTTKELLAAVLRSEKQVFATQGNFNNHIGVPLTLLAIPDESEIAIVEMGANQPGDIKELAEIALPDIGLITNVGHAHLEKLGDLNGVRKTKGALFDFVGGNEGQIFVNQADPHVVRAAAPYGNTITFGTEESDYFFRLLDNQMDAMRLAIYSKEWEQPLEIFSRLTGDYNCMNILAAVAIGGELGISRDGIQTGIASYLPANNRSQMLVKGDLRIWLDAYNANPSSMKASIANIVASGGKRIGMILGDMYELGDEEEELHAELGHFLNTYPEILVIGVGARMEHMVRAHAGKSSHWFASKEELRPQLKGLVKGLDTLLIKGSRSMAMEKLLDELGD